MGKRLEASPLRKRAQMRLVYEGWKECTSSGHKYLRCCANKVLGLIVSPWVYTVEVSSIIKWEV